MFRYKLCKVLELTEVDIQLKFEEAKNSGFDFNEVERLKKKLFMLIAELKLEIKDYSKVLNYGLMHAITLYEVKEQNPHAELCTKDHKRFVIEA